MLNVESQGMPLTKTEKTTLIFLDITFFAVAAIIALLGKLPQVSGGVFVLLLGFAAFRGGRAIAYNYIFKWLRDLFGVVEVDDSSGAGRSNEASGKGVHKVVGELLCCPICAGTWVGMMLLLIYSLYPPFGTALIYALAAAGLGEVLEWVSEYFSWRGRAAREEAGTQWLYKNQPEVLSDREERSSIEVSHLIKV